MSSNEIIIENDKSGFRVTVTWLGVIVGTSALGSIMFFAHTLWLDAHNDQRYVTKADYQRVETDISAIRSDIKDISKAVKP